MARTSSANARASVHYEGYQEVIIPIDDLAAALITVGAAFVYDSSTGRAASGLTVASAEGHAPMVNWDVVSHNWDGMKLQLRDVAVDIEKGWKRITG